MLTRFALTGLLLSPFAVSAACTLINPANQSISLVVGARCAGTEANRPGPVVRAAHGAGHADIAPALAPRNRLTNQEKLTNFNDLKNQANYLAGKRVYYYGQRN
jgi:hypothetical protein